MSILATVVNEQRLAEEFNRFSVIPRREQFTINMVKKDSRLRCHRLTPSVVPAEPPTFPPAEVHRSPSIPETPMIYLQSFSGSGVAMVVAWEEQGFPAVCLVIIWDDLITFSAPLAATVAAAVVVELSAVAVAAEVTTAEGVGGGGHDGRNGV